MKISIIVVTYNASSFIKDCLNSLLSQMEIDYEIFIIDNASVDNTATLLKGYQSQYPEKIRLILNDKNIGFARANNMVLPDITGDYVFCFNPDAVLEQQNALIQLVKFMQDHPECGLVGTKITDAQTRKTARPCVNYINSPAPNIFSNLPGEIAWVCGASFLMPSFLFEKIGGFCEQFFMYGEDMDLCLRVRQSGYTIEHYSYVNAMHLNGGCQRKESLYNRRVRKQHGVYVFLHRHYAVENILTFATYNYKKAKRELIVRKLLGKLGVKSSQIRLINYQSIHDAAHVVLSDPGNPDHILTLIKQ